MTKHDVLFLGHEDIASLNVGMEKALSVIKKTFIDHGNEKFRMPAKTSLDLEDISQGHINLMPAYLEDLNVVGVKVISAYSNNALKGLPVAASLINLYDPETGFPIAIMEGTLITLTRTGAACGVAAEYLSNQNASTLAVVGMGAVAPYHVMAINAVRNLKEIRVIDIREDAYGKFLKALPDELKCKVRLADSYEELVKGADIIITATRTPNHLKLICHEWVSPGALVIETSVKRVIDIDLIKKADKVVVEDLKQAQTGGALGDVMNNDYIAGRKVYAELGQIVSGRKKGRENEEEIIVVWNRGMGIQDIAMAHLIYNMAVENNIGVRLKVF